MRRKNNFINTPVYPGGLKSLRLFVKENMIYPKKALESKIHGSVHVKYIVNEKGIVINTKVLHGIGYGCDEEAMRIVKLFRFNVKRTRGLKLKHNKSIKIHFRLAEAQQQVKTAITQISYSTVKKKDTKVDTEKPNKGGGYGYEIMF